MKKFNYIILLSSFAVISSTCAMEPEPGKWFIRLDSKQQERIKYGMESKDVNYHSRYRAQRQDDGSLLFPVKSTDPLPIQYYHGKRYFITLATGKDIGGQNQACQIVSPAVKQLAIVQGFTEKNKRGAIVYLGLDTDNVQLIDDKRGRKRIYPAKMLLLQK